MNKTSNYKLNLPEYIDPADIDVLNHDLTVLDSVVNQINAKMDNKMTSPGTGNTGDVLTRSSRGEAVWAAVSVPQSQINSAVTSWLNSNVPANTTVAVDKTLAVTNAAAEAKTTGDKLNAISGNVAPIFDAAVANGGGSTVVYNSSLYVLPSGHSANQTWSNTAKEAITMSELIRRALEAVAPPFSTTTSYVFQDFCTYAGSIYRFERNHTGAWTGGDVTKVSLGDELLRVLDSIKTILGLSESQKNLAKFHFEERTNAGVTFSVRSDNSVALSGTATSNAFNTSASSVNHRFKLTPGTYTMSSTGVRGLAYAYLVFYSSQAATTTARESVSPWGDPITFTTTSTYYCSLNINVNANTNVDGVVVKAQLEKGTEATEYVSPYAIQYESSQLNRIDELTNELDIRPAASKNLNAVEYVSRTTGGVTFTVNKDNSITVSGSHTSTVWLANADWSVGHRVRLPAGTYTLSGGQSRDTFVYITFYSSQNATSVARDSVIDYGDANGTVFTTNQAYYVAIQIQINANTATNTTFYPQIERGNKKTRYMSPFLEKQAIRIRDIEDQLVDLNAKIGRDVSGALNTVEEILDVTEFHKNLNTFSYSNYYNNGITATVREDNSFDITGTATANCYLIQDSTINQRFFLPAGTYTVSSGGILNAVYPYVLFYSSQDATSTARDSFSAFRGYGTFTTTNDYYCAVNVFIAEGTEITETLNLAVQLEQGEFVTTYVSPFVTEYASHQLERIDDLEEELGYEVGPSKNFNSCPYVNRYLDGNFGQLTFTVNTNNSVTMTGGPLTSDMYLFSGGWDVDKRFLLPAGTYTLSGGISANAFIYMYCYESQAATTSLYRFYDYGEGTTFTTNDDYYCSIQICILANTPVDGITFYPQVERGRTATRYMSPFKTAQATRFNDIDESIAKLQKQIDNKGTDDLPEYYYANDYIGTKCDRINALARNCSKKLDSFIFVTDQHWTLNAGRSPALCQYIKQNTRVDKLFMGGDLCDFVTSEHQPYDAMTKFLKAWDGPIFAAMGNHDYMSQYGTEGRLYYTFNSVGRERVGNFDRNYFYIDNPQSMIRYIFCNGFKPGNNSWDWGYEDEQRNWVEDVALDVPEGWGIVGVMHMTHNIDNQVLSRTTRINNFISVFDEYSGPGEVIALFSGHTHCDYLDYTVGGIPILVTTCDKRVPWSTEEPWLEDRLEGTIQEQAFDVYLIDREAKTITRVRIGRPIHYGCNFSTGSDYEDVTISYARS